MLEPSQENASASSTPTLWLSNNLANAVAIIVAVLCLYLLIVFVSAVSHASADSLTTIGALIATMLLITVSWKYEKDKEIASTHRRYKAELYENFVVLVFNQFFLGKSPGGQELEEKEILRHVTHFNVKVMLWGNDGVVKAWNDLRKGLLARDPQSKDESLQTAYDFEVLVFAMRRDLGYRDKKLRKGDLLPLFLASK